MQLHIPTMFVVIVVASVILAISIGAITRRDDRDGLSPIIAALGLVALAFVLFDVETAFLYPWAVVFRSMNAPAFLAMFVFMAILLLGLWYAWKKGALEWK